jgi:hypothetical protein
MFLRIQTLMCLSDLWDPTNYNLMSYQFGFEDIVKLNARIIVIFTWIISFTLLHVSFSWVAFDFVSIIYSAYYIVPMLTSYISIIIETKSHLTLFPLYTPHLIFCLSLLTSWSIKHISSKTSEMSYITCYIFIDNIMIHIAYTKIKFKEALVTNQIGTTRY